MRQEAVVVAGRGGETVERVKRPTREREMQTPSKRVGCTPDARDRVPEWDVTSGWMRDYSLSVLRTAALISFNVNSLLDAK